MIRALVLLDSKSGSYASFDWIRGIRSGDLGTTSALMAQMELLTVIGETYTRKVRLML